MNPYEIADLYEEVLDLRERVLAENELCDTCGKRQSQVIRVGTPQIFSDSRLCRLCLVAALAAMDAREGVANG